MSCNKMQQSESWGRGSIFSY